MPVTRDVQLTDVLAMLSKVSVKLTQRMDTTWDRMKKMAGTTKTESKPKTDKPLADAKLTNTLSKIVSNLNNKSEDRQEIEKPVTEEKKPVEVIEDAKPITLVSFGKQAIDQLVNIRKKKEEKPIEKKEEKKEDTGIIGWVKKLIGPALLVLGGIAAFVTGLFSDSGLKGAFIAIGKLGIKGGLLLMAKKIGKFLSTKVLKRIPIIGAILGFVDAWQRFKSDDFVGGSIALVSGLVSLIDLVAPGVGSSLSLGLDILNAVLDAKTSGVDPKERSAAKLSVLTDWSNKITEYLLKIPIIKNFAQFGQGIGDIISGNFKEGLLNMSYALPFFGTILGLIVLPKNTEEASQDISNISDMMNKAMQPVYKSIVGILPSWMQDLITVEKDGTMTFTPGKMFDSIAKKVGKFIGVSEDEDTVKAVKVVSSKIKAEHEKLTQRLEDPELSEEEVDDISQRRDELSKKYKKRAGKPVEDVEEPRKQKEKEVLDTESVKKEEAPVEEYDDFIVKPNKKTGMSYRKDIGVLKPDGKVIKPHKDDTVIGFKPGGPTEKANKQPDEQIKTMKSLEETSKNLLTDQIEILQACRDALEVIAKNIMNTKQSNTSNSISRNTVNNIFPQQSIRDLQYQHT